jgi:transposase-like protein
MADATMPGLPAVRNPLEAQPDLLRELVEQTVNALLSADADALCGAPYGARSSERTNRRNGYRERRWDTRAGSIELQIPKLREGSYFPDWLLDRRRRAEKALISVVADLYLAGVSTRRVEKAIQTLGVESISKSQVSRLCGELDELVEAFRTSALGRQPVPVRDARRAGGEGAGGGSHRQRLRGARDRRQRRRLPRIAGS